MGCYPSHWRTHICPRGWNHQPNGGRISHPCLTPEANVQPLKWSIPPKKTIISCYIINVIYIYICVCMLYYKCIYIYIQIYIYIFVYTSIYIYISYPHKGIIRDSSGDMTSLSAFEAPEDSEAMSFLRRCGHQELDWNLRNKSARQ